MAASRSIPAPGRVIRIVAAAVTAIALTAGISTALASPAAGSAEDPTPSAAPTPGTKVRSECPMPVPEGSGDRIDCGELVVAERRGESADPARIITLPYAVISSASSDPAPDPLVFPTNSAVGAGMREAVEYFLTQGWWATTSRDVIVLEQRGEPLAEPSLDCPEVSAENLTVDGVYLTGATRVEQRQELLAACWERVTAEGVDLGAYTTRSSAADLADLRAALEYDTWNLYGLGYGSRLALTAMRDVPQGLRSVILDAPAPLQVDPIATAPASIGAAVDHLASTCEADADCADRYPDLRATVGTVLESAATAPFTLTVDDPAGGSVQLDLDDTTLARGLVRALADARVVPTLPFVIDQLAEGSADAALPLAQLLVDADGTGSEGLVLSQQCAEVLPFSDEEAVAEAYAADPIAAHLGAVDLVADCATWEVPALTDRASAAVSSDVPALVTVGAFDPIAPNAVGEATVETLSAGRLELFTPMSHGSVWQRDVNGCAAIIAGRFLNDPAGEIDIACVENQPAVGYATTATIDPTTALYRLDRELVQQRSPFSTIVLIASLLVMIATLGYGIAVALGRRVRLRGDIPAGAVAAAVMASSFNLLYALGIAIVFVSSDTVTRSLGLPAAVWPMLLLPFAGIVMTILLIVLLVRAWLQDDGTLAHRIALSVSGAGSIVFTVWLLAHGLLML
ncbi:alpha/beta fold hydrolase [Microbacter sp. GSS18]|nr:alpha/beta fold hydrolase [Microbacter sp. GSS18]